MLLNVYQNLARRTAIYPQIGASDTAGLIYPVLGLSDEVAEFVEKGLAVERFEGSSTIKELAKELGDVLWYVANTAHELRLSLFDVVTAYRTAELSQETVEFTHNDEFNVLGMYVDPALIGVGSYFKLVALAGKVSGTTKKLYRDKNGVLDVTTLNKYSILLGSILVRCAEVCLYLKIDLNEVATNNIDKLQSRQDRNVLKGEGDNR